jgi:integrating conjugative element protein (TIGR03759 family)
MTMTTERSVRASRIGIVGFCLCTILPVNADDGPVPNLQSSNTLEVEQSSTQQIESQTSRAEQWGLDITEWQRYEFLMHGIRGSVSPATLSPIEALGIHARTADERRRYAEKWAVMMRDDAERILAFQRAYDDAQRRLFPNGLLIDANALASAATSQTATEKLTWQPDDRVLFFTGTQCPHCDAVLERLVSQINRFAGIDLYLIDVSIGEESRIRDWAAAKNIDPQWVSDHRITLNIDAGALNQVAGQTGQLGQDLPVLILRREGQLSPLPVSRF